MAFITFTEAINTLPNARMWSILFFLMLLTLGLDTQFGMLEGLVTPLFDAKLFPKVRPEVVTGKSDYTILSALYKPRVFLLNFVYLFMIH